MSDAASARAQATRAPSAVRATLGVPERSASNESSSGGMRVLDLQRYAGNRAVSRMLSGGNGMPRLQRCAACEASGRKCSKCEQDEEQRLRRSPDDSAPVRAGDIAPPIVAEVLRGSGRPLDSATRHDMELHFGRGLEGVRIHTDTRAVESAGAVDAHAYTVGQHIVFNHGRYAPNTAAGRGLLAHELAHTIQQRNAVGSVQTLRIDGGAGGSAAEREAHAAADSVRHGAPVSMGSNSATVLRRNPLGPLPGQGDALGGCGTCLKDLPMGMQIGGALAHAQIQAEAKLKNPWLLIDEVYNLGSDPKLDLDDILDSLGKLAAEKIVKSADIPDIVDPVAEEPGALQKKIRIGEIKPDNDAGRKQGEAQMKRYMRNLKRRKEYRNAIVTYYDDALPSGLPFVLDRTRPKGCPIQKIHVRYWKKGIYLYRCDPPWKQQVKNAACKCSSSGKKKAKGKNFGFGLSINSNVSGGGNAGVGVSINASGTANMTAGAGVVYDSHGNAIASASAGVAANSSANAALAAGAGAGYDTHANVVGAAGAGAGAHTTATGAGVAGAGTATNTDVIAAGVASKGSAKDVDAVVAGATSSGSASNVSARGTGMKGSGDAKDVTSTSSGKAGGSTAQSDDGGSRKGTGTGPGTGGGVGQSSATSAGGAGTGANRGSAVGVPDGANAPDVTQSADMKIQEAEAQRAERALANATPAQRDLLLKLAQRYPQQRMPVPSAAWVEDWLDATKDLKPEHIDKLMQYTWEPPEKITPEEFKKSIDLIVSGKAPPPSSAQPTTPSSPSPTAVPGGTGKQIVTQSAPPSTDTDVTDETSDDPSKQKNPQPPRAKAKPRAKGKKATQSADVKKYRGNLAEQQKKKGVSEEELKESLLKAAAEFDYNTIVSSTFGGYADAKDASLQYRPLYFWLNGQKCVALVGMVITKRGGKTFLKIVDSSKVYTVDGDELDVDLPGQEYEISID